MALPDALGRVTAEDIGARVTQPPATMSAMDGYAVRAEDVATAPVVLRRVGEVQAGSAFDGPDRTGRDGAHLHRRSAAATGPTPS